MPFDGWFVALLEQLALLIRILYLAGFCLPIGANIVVHDSLHAHAHAHTHSQVIDRQFDLDFARMCTKSRLKRMLLRTSANAGGTSLDAAGMDDIMQQVGVIKVNDSQQSTCSSAG